MRVLITRPREDAEEIAVLLRAAGHAPILAPLLQVNFHGDETLSLDGVQAILATSANGVRALARRSARRDLPIFAVGPQTATAAQDAGFSQICNADGDALALAEATVRWTAPDKGALLHVSGESGEGRLAARLIEAGFAVRKAALYDVAANEHLPPEAAEALAKGAVDAALFFSPRSARVFRECVSRENLTAACGGLLAVCISAATAQALEPLGFHALRIAAAPNQAALLACLD
jgi:uroporphyrinogen-III synthase